MTIIIVINMEFFSRYPVLSGVILGVGLYMFLPMAWILASFLAGVAGPFMYVFYNSETFRVVYREYIKAYTSPILSTTSKV